VKVIFDKDQIELFKFTNEENTLTASYSEDFLDKIDENVFLFCCFYKLFGFVDDQALIALVSKTSEMQVLERTLMKSKNEYPTGFIFQRKSSLAHIQVLIFNNYLNRTRNTSIEKLIEEYINAIIRSKYGIQQLKFNFPLASLSFLEKIRILSPEFEFFLRQYQHYVRDGNIDFELLELSSAPLRLSEIGSLVSKKYIYINSDVINNIKHHFYSDQSLLWYVEPYKEKYNNLFDLLQNENVEFDHFLNYQKDIIEALINEDYLYVNENNYIKIKKVILLFLVGELHKKEVLSYWHYPVTFRQVMDEMLESKLLKSESALFTRQEVSYFNYYLNKKEFTNGYDIRNKYLHGTNNASEKQQEFDYYSLLQLIILALLKIEDDILIHRVNLI
jgi:hypothetical protein